MKFKHLFLLYFLFAILCTFFSCKDDDDNGMGDNDPVDTFTAICCQIPHLEGCVGGAKFFLPNAFTPNTDGVNDVFYVFGDQGTKEIASFKIFDEEGVIVFELTDFQPNDPDNGWDGILPDGTLAEGIYSYTIGVTNVADETIEFEGHVCCRSSFPIPCVDNEKHCAFGTQHTGNGGFDFSLPNFENCE